MRTQKGTNLLRKETGSLATVLISVLILISFLLAAFSVDLGHMMLVTEQLQNATDAGALSGAQDLWYNLPNAANDALSVTARNNADGKSVTNSSSGVTVTATVVAPSIATPGTVEVKASMLVNHLFGPLFGRDTDTITVDSLAGTSGSLVTLFGNQGTGIAPFPLAVSIDQAPPGFSPLSEHKIGDTVTFNINSQKQKNAAFTSFTDSTANANYITDAIQQVLFPGQTTDTVTIPPVSIGDNINLSNGTLGQQLLAKQPDMNAFLTPNRPLIMPVIEGPPAYNQQSPVIGFIAFQPTSVSFGNGNGVVETITGTLVAAQVNGISGQIQPGPFSGPLSQMVIGPVQLLR